MSKRVLEESICWAEKLIVMRDTLRSPSSITGSRISMCVKIRLRQCHAGGGECKCSFEDMNTIFGKTL